MGIAIVLALAMGVLIGSSFNCKSTATPVPLPGISVAHDTLKVGAVQFDTVKKIKWRVDTLVLHDTITFTDTILERVTGANTLADGPPDEASIPKKHDLFSLAPIATELISAFVPPTPRQPVEFWAGIKHDLFQGGYGGFIQANLNLDRLGLLNATAFAELRYSHGVEGNVGIEGKLGGLFK